MYYSVNQKEGSKEKNIIVPSIPHTTSGWVNRLPAEQKHSWQDYDLELEVSVTMCKDC